jgi:hypothetical protein
MYRQPPVAWCERSPTETSIGTLHIYRASTDCDAGVVFEVIVRVLGRSKGTGKRTFIAITSTVRCRVESSRIELNIYLGNAKENYRAARVVDLE